MVDRKLQNVMLPLSGTRKTFDLTITDKVVTSVTPLSTQHICPSLLLPSLCHPHLHLDKAYIVTSNNPAYAHLVPETGTFTEALTTTAQAKALYTENDLYRRGSQVLATAYSQGATTARTFVEVDATTGTLPLRVARRLKRNFAHLVELQIVAFAQEPLFSGPHGEANRRILTETLAGEAAADVSVLGTTPYVETNREAETSNIAWAIRTAIAKNLHLDFHLDYNLDADFSNSHNPPLTYEVISNLKSAHWNTNNESKTVVLGHCTRLSLLSDAHLLDLARMIREANLPVHFVGLPTSDLFMMGRDHQPKPRGTLPAMEFIRHGMEACLGVNNVGNAFTPFGTADPLNLASWGVGIYQAGTEADAETLYGCVSWRARRAIGIASEQDGKVGDEANIYEGLRWRPMLLVENRSHIDMCGQAGGGGNEDGDPVMMVPARHRLSIRDVVWDPPEVSLRRVINLQPGGADLNHKVQPYEAS